MADIWFDVDTALAEVPVNILPLCDDSDFKSVEAAVAYNAAGLALNWHFVTTAGAYSVTAVTPTDTGGNYDWQDPGTSGVYTIEIPASGGASINNDTEGFGWFTGVATGILPWRSAVYGFRAAAINNALIDGAWSDTRGLAGTALPDAAADAAGGLPISDAGGLDLDTYIKRLEAAWTAALAARLDENVSAAKTLTVAYDAAKTAAAAGAKMDLVDAPNATALAAVKDAVQAAGTTLATLLSRLVGTIAAGTHNAQSGDAYARIGANGAGLTALEASGAAAAAVSGLSTFDPATDTVDVGKVAGVAVAGVDDFKADVSGVSTFDASTDKVDLVDAPNRTALAAVAVAFLDSLLSAGDSDALDDRTVRSALRAIRNKIVTSAGTLTVCKEDDTAVAWTAAVTEDAAANPITEIDPS